MVPPLVAAVAPSADLAAATASDAAAAVNFPSLLNMTFAAARWNKNEVRIRNQDSFLMSRDSRGKSKVFHFGPVQRIQRKE